MAKLYVHRVIVTVVTETENSEEVFDFDAICRACDPVISVGADIDGPPATYNVPDIPDDDAEVEAWIERYSDPLLLTV
jgi:hypothetical protein